MAADHPQPVEPTPDARLTRLDLGLALLIFAGSLALFLATMGMGFTRDESFYFHAAFQYIGWFEELARNWDAGHLAASFGQASIDRHWAYNPEHPVLMKTLFALSWKLFADTLEWTSASTAMRLPTAVFSSALLATVYLWARQLFGRGAGVVAAGLLLLQPRFFFHAHMAAFDAAITALWVMVAYAYWRSFGSRRWAVACGLLWGVALSVKLNAFFLPGVLGGHWLLVSWRHFGWRREGEQGRKKLRLPPIPWAFVSMVVFGPLLFFGLWPRHWFDTVERVQWYMNFHLRHVHYFVDYFGEWLQHPPFPVSFPWVMTLVTVPATILLAFFVGVGFWWSRRGTWERATVWWRALRQRRMPDEAADDPRGTGLLLAINVAFPIALIAMPETPVFGGTKHWMPAMPFLAIVGGGGVAWAARALADAWRPTSRGARAGAFALVAASVLTPAALATAESHPFGTSYYNELIGSYRGAADQQMMRQFWGYASRQALGWLNENAPKGARVYTHNTTGYAWGMYRRDGMRRPDLRGTGLAGSDYALYHHQKAFVYRLIEIWEEYGTKAPVYVVSIDGVPVLSVYERPAVRRRRLGD